ncbi:hypothetical protein CGMCC3_g17140 [Colletotrichum fructicola]|nr:uncharacterized protein CGMCC3_g17140 [Colletotrichum fructicola]KAE9566690.1 hypothetical protein CGMCC3_g17140 [Colletotrichum fructicola]
MSSQTHPITLDRGKRFDEKNLERLKDCDYRQGQFRDKIVHGRKFVTEKDALDVQSREDFESFWKTTQGARAQYDANREIGIGRVAKGMTNLAALANDILQNISPILDLVKDFGAPYGGMAIGTICFVFVVAKNRARMEEQIATTFLHIKDRLPGIKVYQPYSSFISFCMEAFEFYTRGGLRRWFQSLQSNTNLDDRSALVQKSIVDVRLLCEDLLNKNVDTVKNELRDVKAINIGLQRQLSDLQENTDKINLEKISKLLEVLPFPDDNRHVNLSRHQGNVAAEFSWKNDYSGATVEERMQAVENDSVYQDWLVRSQSRVFVISGANDNRNARHCWVSPVALNMVAKFRSDKSLADSNIYVFYLLGLRDEDDTWDHVVCFLTYQLLELNKRALRNEEQCRQLWADLQSYANLRADSAKTKPTDVTEKLERIALRTLSMFDAGKTVWIILDRVDRCHVMPGQSSKTSRKGGRSLLRMMVHLAEKSPVTVKVLAVVNRADWHIEDQADEMDGEMVGSLVVRTYRQNGERLFGDL